MTKESEKMTARNILEVRKVGEDVGIDVVQTYAKTGDGAQIVAKGVPPTGSGISATSLKHEIYQVLDGFNVHEKDLKLDSSLYNRMVDICMRNIRIKEDDFAINGSTKIGVNGLVQSARANSNGKVAFADIVAAWGAAAPDPHADVVKAISKMDEEFEPVFLVGRRQQLLNLFKLDSERQMFLKTMAPLFGKTTPNDTSWIWMTKRCPEKFVYVITKDMMAAEFVVSENPAVKDRPIISGGNFPIDVMEWVVPEFHNNDGFVEIEVQS